MTIDEALAIYYELMWEHLEGVGLGGGDVMEHDE